MTLLVLGLSHRSAPVSVIDRAALPAPAVTELLRDVVGSAHVGEAMVVATCNRVEVYADVARFHGAVEDITALIGKHSGLARDELVPYLYVHYDDRAALHAFEVASGLDSMVVGEQQILGQMRQALRTAQDHGTAGKTLHDLAQSALRVGKRVHAETGIDAAGASVVSVGLDIAAAAFGGAGRIGTAEGGTAQGGTDEDGTAQGGTIQGGAAQGGAAQGAAAGLTGKRALVVGAGAMSSLAVAALARAGVADLTVTNRTPERAARLATSHGARSRALAELGEALLVTDLLVSCTGSTGLVLDADDVRYLLRRRSSSESLPLVILDLAVPHDTDPEIGELAGVIRIDVAMLAERGSTAAAEVDVDRARLIVEAELAAFTAARAAERVEPIVVSLRARATAVVEAELRRLRLRLAEVDDTAMLEIEHAMRRAAATLLHTPTVRMKRLAADPEGERYAQALQLLFDLDAATVGRLADALEVLDDASPGSGAIGGQGKIGPTDGLLTTVAVDPSRDRSAAAGDEAAALNDTAAHASDLADEIAIAALTVDLADGTQSTTDRGAR